jgi:acyl carrier protein
MGKGTSSTSGRDKANDTTNFLKLKRINIMLPTHPPLARQPVLAASLEELTEQIRSVVASTLKRPIEEVRANAALGEELGIDSLTLIDLNIALEQRFQITLPDFISPEETSVRTIEDLARLVIAQVSGTGKGKP